MAILSDIYAKNDKIKMEFCSDGVDDMVVEISMPKKEYKNLKTAMSKMEEKYMIGDKYG